MKKNISISLILLLLCSTTILFSQSLTIGSEAPALKPYKWIKGEPVKEYAPGKIYIIEFGATWCAPCVKLIPELTALQAKYADELTVVSLFVKEPRDISSKIVPSYMPRVQRFIDRHGTKINYRLAVDDEKGTLEKDWLTPSGRTGIPQTYIIDRAGRIAWIGSNPEALQIALEKVLNPKYTTQYPIKIDSIPRPINKDIVLDEIKDNTLLLSRITRYRSGDTGPPNNSFITSFLWADTPELKSRQGKVQVVGESLRRLFYMAYGDTLWNAPMHMYPMHSGIYIDTLAHPYSTRSYGKYWYRPLLEVQDSSLFEVDYQRERNRYNYLLAISGGAVHATLLQKRMQEDLKTLFKYDVSVELRQMPVWRLTRLRDTKSFGSINIKDNAYRAKKVGNIMEIENAEVRDIIFQLEIKYGYSFEGHLVFHPDKQPPFIDATGIKGKINYSYNIEVLNQISEDSKTRNTFEDYKAVVRAMGFDLVRGTKQMKVVVIRDRIE
jgi:thiol-disulfide isomerase/thioredoxin